MQRKHYIHFGHEQFALRQVAVCWTLRENSTYTLGRKSLQGVVSP